MRETIKELRFDGIIYLEMGASETEEQAEERLLQILENAGICVSEHSVSVSYS